MQYVGFSITVQSVHVQMATMAIRSHDVSRFLDVSCVRKTIEAVHWVHIFFLQFSATSRPNDIVEIRDPCYPSPCGLHSQCRNTNGIPSCSCLPNYIGAPPNCRPECIINQECVSSKACIREKCQDPCLGACGISAQCTVRDHTANCMCIAGYVGDPFSNCHLAPVNRKTLF